MADVINNGAPTPITVYGRAPNGQLQAVTTDGNGNLSITSGSAPIIASSGLIGQYRILPTETASALVDYSGNGNNATGTVGTAPTIVSGTGGISCTGNGAVTLPTALNSALTIQLFCFYDSSSNANVQNAPVAGNGNLTNTNAIQFLLVKNTSGDAWAGPITGGARPRSFSPGNSFKVSAISAFSGFGSLTLTMGKPGGGDANDHLFINGTEVQYGQTAFASAGLQTVGFYQLGGAAAGSGNATQTYFTGTIYYALFYNRVLTPSELSQNVAAMNQEMVNRGVIPNLNIPIQTVPPVTDRTNQLVVVGDSETNGAATGSDFWPSDMTLNGTWNIANQSFPGESSTTGLAAEQYTTNTLFKSGAISNGFVVWLGTNDNNPSLSNGNNRQICLNARSYGFKTLVATMMSRTGADATKNALNTTMRQLFETYADGLVDIASDPNLGADGASTNTTYFTGGIHVTSFAVINLVSYYFQRAINRLFGNNDFSSATTYTSGAPAAATVSAATQVGNTATYTTSAPHGFSAGQIVTIAGVTPGGYNGTFKIVTVPTGSTFTCFLSVTGLGALSVAGTAAVPLQKDADVYQILGGSSASQNYTLQTAIAYTGQKIYLKNTNTNAWTVTPFGNETIDGAASLSLATGKTLVLESVLASAAAGGCNWMVIQNG